MNRGILEVWGGWVRVPGHHFATPHHGQARAIVRARSRAAVGRALAAAGLHMADGFLRNYWSVTGNDDELNATRGTEDVVFITTGMLHGPFAAERYKGKQS